MGNITIVIFLMAILITLSAFADKLRLPLPILLVIVGLVIGFIPFIPDLRLNPEIVLLVFLPPLLYHAAIKTSWHDFRKEIRTISTLAITLVFFTTVIVAIAAYYLIPGFTWPVAFVLGAIISPPDAVAATSIIKGLGLSRRVVTIIEGESLVNDASALIAYRYAVGATMSGTFVLWQAGLEFLLVASGGILIGLLVGYVLVFAYKKINDNPLPETCLSLTTPFISYLIAEQLNTSGVLAVVSTGLYITFRSSEILSSQTRLQTNTVWETIDFILNGMVFIFIGLQLPGIVRGLQNTTITQLAGYGIIISMVSIVVRILWVFAVAYPSRLFSVGPKKRAESREVTSWKNVLIVGWTGTRGVVSLATAIALPITLPNGHPFPKRHSILLLAFIVILVTLVVQGLTLPLLIKLLKVKPQINAQEKEEKNFQLEVSKSILAFINRTFPGKVDEKVLDQVRRQYEIPIKMFSKNKTENDGGPSQAEVQFNFISQMLSTQLEIVKYERELLNHYHKKGMFNDDIIREAEQELDIEELRLETMVTKRTLP